jgi:flagellar FliJ protein
MAFEFRLQKVLDYREKQKKMAQEELVLSQIELQTIQGELVRLEDEEEKLFQFQRNSQDQNIDALTLFSIDNYRLFLQESYESGLQALEKQEKVVDERRNEVVERWREFKIMGKLKENALNDHFLAEKVQEQHHNDEISLYNYLRRDR